MDDEQKHNAICKTLINCNYYFAINSDRDHWKTIKSGHMLYAMAIIDLNKVTGNLIDFEKEVKG